MEQMIMDLLRKNLAWNGSTVIEGDNTGITVCGGLPWMVTGAFVDSVSKVANAFRTTYSVVIRNGQLVIRISLP